MNSKFAIEEEVFSPQFRQLNTELLALQKQYGLQDHTALNNERFSWSERITEKPVFYAARLWEFPYAILAGELKPGMKVADVGCGNTPFTAYLAKVVGGSNVTGYDPDYIVDDAVVGHSHFGARKSYINALGIHFHNDGMTKLTAPDESFDVVYCISVLEHVDDIEVKQKGIAEMARLVKPGGKLILTFDVGIKMPLSNIFDIIQYSGLIPLNLDLKWPLKRFVNYGDGMTVDVFGLILEKTADKIFADSSETKTIPMYEANEKAKRKAEFYAVAYNQVLAARDLKSKWGGLKVFIKDLLKKY
jgi:ubiquinone/menaquinone biosynthesis C-methylase UbiE